MVLPTDDLDLGSVDFAVTTDYHWERFDVDATDKTNGFEVVQGPFQFGKANKLEKEKQQVSTMYICKN